RRSIVARGTRAVIDCGNGCAIRNVRVYTSHETTAFEITGCRAPGLRHRTHSFVNAANPAGCSTATLVRGRLATTETRGPRNHRKHALDAGGRHQRAAGS